MALAPEIQAEDETKVSEPLLEVAALTRRFGGVTALSSVNLSVNFSEAVGIVGPNGSGKTTFLNVASGLMPPSGGRVFWKGQDVTTHSMASRSRKGLVRSFQQTMLFDRLSVRENLQMPAVAREKRLLKDQEVRDLVDMVGLPDRLLGEKAGTLSWGQSRLLGVALALACKPQMIMLDEPLAGLAPAAADDMVSVLRRLRGNDVSLVIVEHSVGRLASMTDRMILFHEGANLAEGEPEELLASDLLKRVYFGVDDDHDKQS